MVVQNSEKILLVEGLHDKWFFEKFIQTYCPEISVSVNYTDNTSLDLRINTSQDLGGTHNNKEAVIKQMQIQLRSLDKPIIVGAILDADYVADGGGTDKTLSRVKNIFNIMNVEITDTQKNGSGYIFNRSDEMPASGLWVMDNLNNEGQFENWLIRVMDESEKTNCFQEASTSINTSIHKKFNSKQRIKAEVLTWLAWQVKPDAGLLNVFKSRNNTASLFNENHPDFENLKKWLSMLFCTNRNSQLEI